MQFIQEKNALICRRQGETLRIEPWGRDALRVRATMYPAFSGRDWALTEALPEQKAQIVMGQEEKRQGDGSSVQLPLATVTNGRVSVTVNHGGVLTF